MNKNEFAPTPPMGWNSYDYYDTTVNEQQVKANADYMAAHLKQYGWEYVVIDIEWYSNDAGTKREQYQYIPFGDDEMDTYGRLQPAPNRFPSSIEGKGFAPLADYVHRLGLKFGIHIMRGIPRKAAQNHLPIFQSDFTAEQAADAASICIWNPDMYGIRDNAAGQAYYNSIISMYADWGVDFIKCDDICDSRLYREPLEFSGWHETQMIHRAIVKCGRPIVLSLSPGPAHVDRAWHYAQNANMWRITDDLWDKWDLLKEMFWRCENWQDHVKKGCYPDCDMLPLGHLGKGFGQEWICGLSHDEQRTMMTLWCMFRSPLMLGCELTKLDEWTKTLITNRPLLSLLKEDRRGRQIARTDTYAIWVNESENGGALCVALFNLKDSATKLSVDFKELEGHITEDEELELWDLWEDFKIETQHQTIETEVAPHGVKVYLYAGV